MDLRLRLEIGKFNSALREMSARLSHTIAEERIVEYEVGKIIEATLAGTRAATVSGIRASAETAEWTTYNGKRYKLSNRYPNALWRGIAAKRKESLMRKIAARGLAKQSWLALANLIGVEIRAPGFVRSATAPTHTNSENVNIRRDYGARRFGLGISNTSPLLRFSDGRRAFFSAVIGRRRFYETNLRRGVFGDLAKIAAKYPGLKMTY